MWSVNRASRSLIGRISLPVTAYPLQCRSYKNEVDEPIEHVERLGGREGIYTTNWYKHSASDTTFKGYDTCSKVN